MSARLSAVVITPDGYSTIERTMRSLHSQTRRGEIEILLCAPTRDAAGPERPEWKDFAAFRILETGPVKIIAKVKALAMRVAQSPIVAFTEEHAFPEPGWADALIERHREPHAVVGPMMANPNPQLAISWANFIVEYGPWLEPAPAGLRQHLPGNNSCYKRDLLLAYGDRLEAMLDAESLLHWDLLAQGHTMYLETRAVTRHLNITQLAAFRRVHRQYGRMFAAQRSHDWNPIRKLIYGLGSPLIPLIRIARHWPDIQRAAGVPRGNPAFWGYLLLALVESAFGEMLGYLAGPGASREHIFDLEFHRSRYVDPRDESARRALA